MIDQILRLLDNECAKLSHSALVQPQDRDGFEYGKVCGMYQGLQAARKLIVGLNEENEDRDNKL